MHADDADDLCPSHQFGPAQVPRKRSQGGPDGRGHRRPWRCLPCHRRAAERLRQAPRRGHPARRVRHHGHRRRPGIPRVPSGGGDPVRRLHLPGVRPDRQPGRQDALPHPGRGQDAHHHPRPVRRRHRLAGAPLGIARGLLHPHLGAARDQRVQPPGRLHHDPASHRLRRSRPVLRAQAALPRQGRGGRERRPELRPVHGKGPCCHRGHGRHPRGLRPAGQDRPRRRHGGRRRRHLG
ncbi:hypothetical protein SRABI128_05200 [Microbacterium sp. Bi128]|nr:hypothetical protein SRABI128_05200 [Microbacterium sp. Bi128]